MVDEVEKGPATGPLDAGHADAAVLQRKVRDGIAAERRLDDGSVAPWELSRLRRLAVEGRKAQLSLRQRGHEPSLPEEAVTDE